MPKSRGPILLTPGTHTDSLEYIVDKGTGRANSVGPFVASLDKYCSVVGIGSRAQ